MLILKYFFPPITTGVTLRPVWKSLPDQWLVPYRIEQSWTYYNPNLQKPTVPVDTTHILRSPLRSLPDQPAQQLAPTWTQPVTQNPAVAPFSQQDWPNPYPVVWYRDHYQNLAQNLKAPFYQTDWPLPGQPPRVEQTWTWKYNQNLIGKDQLPTGQQVYVLTPGQVVPEQVQLHSWYWNYNVNLIGQDKLPNRQQDWPLTPAAQFANNLNTWAYQYNPNLIGQDKLPQLQKDWPNPYPVQWDRFWSQSLAVYIKTAPIPFNQSDWPLPGAYPRLDQFTGAYYNPNLIGKDVLPIRQQDWPNPIIAPQVRDWRLDWSQNLAQALKPPFYQTDWPLPTQPFRPEYTTAAFYNPNLIGKDKLPQLQKDWPNPQPVQWDRFWSQSPQVPTVFAQPFNQFDWPVPIATPYLTDFSFLQSNPIANPPPKGPSLGIVHFYRVVF